MQAEIRYTPWFGNQNRIQKYIGHVMHYTKDKIVIHAHAVNLPSPVDEERSSSPIQRIVAVY